MKFSTLLSLIILAIALFSTNKVSGQCAAFDVINPIISCPEDVTGLTCIDVIPAGATTVDEFNAIDAMSLAIDNCGIEFILFSDDPDPSTFTFCFVDGPFVVTRTYTVIDTAGLEASCDQTFTFEADTEDPVVTSPGNIGAAQGMACEDLFDPGTLEALFGEGFPTLTDNCAGSANEADIMAVPEVADGFDEGEEVSVGSFTLSYSDNVIIHPDGICTDPGQRKFRIRRTWTVTDACGNSDNIQQRINVGDQSTPPVPGLDAAELTYVTSATCTVEIAASDIEDGSTDNCGDNSIDPSTYDVSASALIRVAGIGAFVTDLSLSDTDFDLATACPFSLGIELQVTDECGNTATAIKIVMIDDEAAPIITTCIADTTLYGCSTAVIVAPMFPFSPVSTNITEVEFEDAGGDIEDNCGINTVSYRDSVDINNAGCPDLALVILRTFDVLDNCDNLSQCVQVITILDTVPPMLICPFDTIAGTSTDGLGNCTAVLEGLELVVSDSCSNMVNVSYSLIGATTGNGFNDVSGTEFLVGETTVTYYAEDCVGNIDSCSFLVTIIDDERPILVCPGDFTVNTDPGVCDAVVDYTITASDNCSPFVHDSIQLLVGIDSAGTFPLGVTMVQIRYSDTLGNADTCMFNVTVLDMEDPVITCIADMSIQLERSQCDTILVFDDPTVTDNCMSPITINRLDNTGLNSGSTFNIGNYTLIYEAVDASDNRDTCELNIEVLEFVMPAIVSLSELNVSIDETCMGNLTPAMVLLGDELGCLDSCTITVLDENGDVRSDQFDGNDIGKTFTYRVTCQGLISEGLVNIEDKFPPQIACVSDTITCAQLVVHPQPIITENCSGATLTLLNETYEAVDCNDPELQQIITRTYQAVDQAGNVSNTCTQTLSISKFDIGTVTPPLFPNVPLECGVPFPADSNGNPDPIVYGSPQLGGKNLFPEQFLVCNLIVNYDDQTLQTAANETSIVRTWTASSWYCGVDTMRTFVQVFTIADNAGPVMTCPGDMSFSTEGIDCSITVDLPAIPVSDICGDVVNVDVDYEGGVILGNNGGEASLPMGASVVTYIATDSNGNKNSCSFNVFVEDNEQPITICDQFTEVALSNDGKAVIDASVFDDGSFDPCSPVTLQVRRMNATCDPTDVDFGESVTFCCVDLGEEQMVVLRVTDANGNFNECMVTVNVDDKIAPQLIAGLPDITLSCEFPFNEEDLDQFGSIVMDFNDREPILLTAELVQFDGEAMDGLVIGNCIELISDDFVFSSFNSCGQGSATRVLTFANAQGLTVTDVQVLTFVNPSPFTINDINFPNDISFTNLCDMDQTLPANLPAGQNVPVYTEDQCDQVAYTYDDQVIDDSNGALSCYIIIRTFTVVDWCQTINGSFASFEGEQVITVSNNIDPEITGDCSNITQCSYDLACGPMYVELTNEGSDDCTSDEFLLWTYEIDLFSDSNIDIVGNTTDASGTYPVGFHTITWTLQDACGNDDECSYTFEIQNCKAATPICIDNLTTELIGTDTDGDNVPDTEQVTITASYFDGGSYHVCGTPVTLSFSADVADSVRVYGCDDIGEQPIELWVTDENGNQDFCTTSLDVQNNMDLGLCPVMLTYTIQGDLYNEMDEMIAKGDIELQGGEITVVTEEDGHYDFGEMPLGGVYTVHPNKDIDYLNGITTLDIILIQKHILGISLLDSPFKIIAADVNHSESITGLDIIQIRKLILGHTDEFEDNTSWRFVDGDHVFLDPMNPWITDIPAVYDIASLNADMLIDFTGVKIGDVNNSSSPNEFIGEQIDTRTNTALRLSIEERSLKAGDMVWIPVYADNFEDVLAFQLGGAFAQKANILDVRGVALEIDATNFDIDVERASLKLLWHAQESMTVPTDRVLFEIQVEAKENMNSSDLLSMDDAVLRSEVYNNALEVAKIEIEARSRNYESGEIFAEISMDQNEPNPWMNSTSITVNSTVFGASQLRILDMTGKVILAKEVILTKGKNELILTNEEVPVTGVLYYELEIADTKLMKKMVVIQ